MSKVLEEVIKLQLKYNPYLATGEDLDRIGELCGLEREYNEWLESDMDFRIRVLHDLAKYI